MASKNNKWLIIGLVLIVLLLIAAVFIKGKSKPKGLEVDVEKVAKRTIYEKVAASGKIFPETEVKISSDVSGEIVNLYVAEGDSVARRRCHKSSRIRSVATRAETARS